MKVAVLLSAYNGETYIREQIDSILHQERDFELDLWVRDDDSTDQTREILDEYAKAGKLRWYTGHNIGSAHSFIDLIRHCGEYDFYAFSDQDDLWMPQKLQNGIRHIYTLDTAALYVANAELVDGNLTLLGKRLYKKTPRTDFHTLVCAGGLLGCTMVFNRQLARYVQEYPCPPKLVMHDFYLAVLCAAVNGKIIFDELPCMKYRQHGRNVYGVPHGFKKTLLSRLETIWNSPSVSIADQAECLLAIDEIDKEKKQWLKTVAQYRNSLWSRFQLAASARVSYVSRNQAITMRIAIFFGNR